MANATATLVGQNLGAGQPDRAERTVWKAALFNVIFLFIISLVFIFFAEKITSFFTQDAAVIDEASRCLRILSFGYIFFAYQMTLNQAFNGAGDTYTPTLITFCVMWLVQIPMAYIVSVKLGYGSVGVYAAIVISNLLASIITITVFRKGRWKQVKV